MSYNIFMIYIAGDKHGYGTTQYVAEFLKSQNIPFVNLGVQNEGEDMKLQDLIPKVVEELKKDSNNKAILSCGTGVGIEVGANKFAGIRAVLATEEKVAEWSRVYDNCNVLCLVGWEADKDKIEKIVEAWLKAEYDGNEGRLEMLKTFDTWH